MGKIKVVTVVTKDKAIELFKTKSLSNYKTLNNIGVGTMEVIKYALRTKEIPIIGFNRIYGKPVSIAKDWDILLDFLPSKAGNIYFEIEVEEDKCLFLEHDKLINFSLLERQRISKTERNKKIDELIKSCKHEEIKEGTTLVLLPKIELKDCKFFNRLKPSWDREEGIEGILLNNLDNLSNF